MSDLHEDPEKTWPFDFSNIRYGKVHILKSDLLKVGEVFDVIGWDDEIYYGLRVEIKTKPSFIEFYAYWSTKSKAEERRIELLEIMNTKTIIEKSASKTV
jgi:rRNA processing protein Gar1